MQPKRNNVFLYLIALMLVIMLVTSLTSTPVRTDEYAYTEIVGYFQNGHVQEYLLDLNTGELNITKLKGKNVDIVYKVPDLGVFVKDTTPYILEYNENNPKAPIVGYMNPPKDIPWWVNLLPLLLVVVGMVFLGSIMMRQARGGGAGGAMDFGKARTRKASEGRRVTFADVAGADEEKQELVEVIDFLRSPGKFSALGARIPKGVMLVGPPGTGKTLLARAVAGEADVEFFSISGSDFVEMFVGVGASRVRDLFNQAKKAAPSVIFIDEIDAVGRQRGAGLGGGNDEREQTLNQLLVEMDGFSTNMGVIVLAATNRSDILDPALLRPGRFDRQVIVGYPDIKGREEILKIHSQNKPLAPDVKLDIIAQTTVGFNGADLENLMNEAALLAARRNKKAITMEEVSEATIKVVAGPEKKSRVVTEKERAITAYHEAGHAVASYYCPTQDAVHQISIIPRGMAGGYTLSLPAVDQNYRTKQQMYEDIVVLMGGRVAEAIILDDISTGASNDLERATKIARNMVTRYGFSDKVGPIVYGEDQSQVFLGRDYLAGNDMSQETAAEIDGEIRTLIVKAYDETKEILTNHIDQLKLIAKQLLAREKIEADEFQQLMEQGHLNEEKPLTPEPLPEPSI